MKEGMIKVYDTVADLGELESKGTKVILVEDLIKKINGRNRELRSYIKDEETFNKMMEKYPLSEEFRPSFEQYKYQILGCISELQSLELDIEHCQVRSDTNG